MRTRSFRLNLALGLLAATGGALLMLLALWALGPLGRPVRVETQMVEVPKVQTVVVAPSPALDKSGVLQLVQQKEQQELNKLPADALDTSSLFMTQFLKGHEECDGPFNSGNNQWVITCSYFASKETDPSRVFDKRIFLVNDRTGDVR
jgi:hypothetical protein